MKTKAPARRKLQTTVLTNKGRGYSINEAGNRQSCTVDLPRDLGYKKGDRVYLYPISFEGMEGVFISKSLKE